MSVEENIEKLNFEELLEVSMVIFNINKALKRLSKSDTKSDVKIIKLQADYHNYSNPYWVALWPHLERYDDIDISEIALRGEDAIIHWYEESSLKLLSERGCLRYSTLTELVEDIYATGRAGEYPVSYTIHVNIKVFQEYSSKIIQATRSKMTTPAELTFSNFSRLVITSENISYTLGAMRSGKAYDIIFNCYEKHIDESVGLNQITKDMNIDKVKNINEVLRKSHFDKSDGLLRAFVDSSPTYIRVKKSIEIPLNQLEDIISASKKTV